MYFIYFQAIDKCFIKIFVVYLFMRRGSHAKAHSVEGRRKYSEVDSLFLPCVGGGLRFSDSATSVLIH